MVPTPQVGLSRAPGKTLGHCRAQDAAHISGWHPNNPGSVAPEHACLLPRGAPREPGQLRGGHFRTTRQLYHSNFKELSESSNKYLKMAVLPPSWRQGQGGERGQQAGGVQPRGVRPSGVRPRGVRPRGVRPRVVRPGLTSLRDPGASSRLALGPCEPSPRPCPAPPLPGIPAPALPFQSHAALQAPCRGADLLRSPSAHWTPFHLPPTTRIGCL